MHSTEDKPDSNQKRLAWGGTSFLVPKNWDIATYDRIKRRIWRLKIEDEYALRMEIEWTEKIRKNLDEKTILQRYEKEVQELTNKADNSVGIKELPRGWSATDYYFSGTEPKRDRSGQGSLKVVKHGLLTAFYLSPQRDLFCSVVIHFQSEYNEEHGPLIRRLARSFEHHTKMIPWQFMDISFSLPREFLLENTLFGIGAKLMIFRWNLRRFYVWHLSCADTFLKEGVNKEKWAAAYINDYRKLKAVRFTPGTTKGMVQAKRRFRHKLGHIEEIARWCFKYDAGCRYDEATNQLIIWVFNYRNEKDLEILPDYFRRK